MLTAECVTPEHPDKICDRISDAILDRCLKEDPFSRVAVETMAGHGQVIVMGEITTSAKNFSQSYCSCFSLNTLNNCRLIYWRNCIRHTYH